MHSSSQLSQLLVIGLAATSYAGVAKPRASSAIPDYFQTSFGPYAGPTKAGGAPFLAQATLLAPEYHSYKPNTPVVTDVPILGGSKDADIFKHMGNISPYLPNPSGFGVDEYPLPFGTNITQMHMVHRHGSRYPTSDASVATVSDRITELRGNGTSFTGDLSFLNDWTYQLGEEELTALGRQQLFDSGVLNWFNYGKLYDPSRPLISRTTTQIRMLQSAENFLNGFFGPNWTRNVTLEVITEHPGFNNSLASDKECTNHNNGKSSAGDDASSQWQEIYLRKATQRFRQSMTGNPNWTNSDTYNLQTLCPYETVALGFSRFCSLFTWDEWLGFEYANDLSYYGGNGFASPTGRAVGVGYVEELIARLQHHLPYPDENSVAINETLDDNTMTFPLNQTLYLDFSHDTNMFSMLTALGLKQFAEFLPTSGPPPDRQLIVSHIVPFAGRFNIEIIKAPRPVLAKRPRGSQASAYEPNGTETTYVHMMINQRTVPLGQSIVECGQRDDGWCELQAFINVQKDNIVKANFDKSCFGNYSTPKYGSISTGTV